MVSWRLASVWLLATTSVVAQQPTFRSSVDLILVDAQVVDDAGRPVSGLGASDFSVAIDGKVRQIVSVDFRTFATPQMPPVRGLIPSSPRATNELAPTGPSHRLFVLTVDAASLSDEENAGLLRALDGFVGRLAPEDLVAVFTLPHGPSLRPTTDRAAVRKVVGSIAGGSGLRARPMNLSPVEVAEIVTSPSNPSGSTPPRRGSGPAPIADDVFGQVQARECGSAANRGCMTALVVEAEILQRQLEQEVSQSLASLRGLLMALNDYPGQKTVVLASSGMPLRNLPGGWNSGGGEARAIGEEAARSRTSIYTLHIDRGLNRTFSPQVRDIRLSTSVSRETDERVLFDLAAASGGAMFSVPVDFGERALDRLLLETSTLYLLGVSPEKIDLDGRTHTLSVKLTSGQRGTIARHRKFVVLRPRPYLP